MHSLEAGRVVRPVRPDQKVLLHFRHHCRRWTWCSLLLQLLRMLLLVVLQVRLGCLLWGVAAAEVVVVARWCVSFSLVPVFVWIHTRVACLGSV
jgi:hypothetical protein